MQYIGLNDRYMPVYPERKKQEQFNRLKNKIGQEKTIEFMYSEKFSTLMRQSGAPSTCIV